MDEQMQLQIVALVLAAMQGDQQAQQQVQQIMEAAQQGDPQAQLIAQLILQIIQLMLGQQALMAKLGAKINYIKYLRGKCPEGYEMQYFKNGGKAGCRKCRKSKEGGKAQPEKFNPNKWKRERTEKALCGKKMKKKAYGGSVKKGQKGLDTIPNNEQNPNPETLSQIKKLGLKYSKRKYGNLKQPTNKSNREETNKFLGEVKNRMLRPLRNLGNSKKEN